MAYGAANTLTQFNNQEKGDVTTFYTFPLPMSRVHAAIPLIADQLTTPMPHLHDRGYRRLFSNRSFFRQLLQSFVHEPWVNDIDFSTAQTLDRSFITEHYKQTETDLLYKVKFHGQDAYIYLLIEFQSTNVWFMALRLLHYISGFWLDFLHQTDDSKKDPKSQRSKPKDTKLPPVFPMLVYNGDAPWTAVTDIRELLERPDLLGDYAPQFHYLPIAANAYGKDYLLSIHNLVSTLFLAESDTDFQLVKQTIVDLFDQETDRDALSALVNWYRQLVLHGRQDRINYEELSQAIASKQEATTMLETALEQAQQQWLQQGLLRGRQEGHQEGRQEGRQEGLLESLILLLEERFGKLSDKQITLLQQQSADTLRELMRQFQAADSLDRLLSRCVNRDE